MIQSREVYSIQNYENCSHHGSEKADYASSAFLWKKLKIILVLPNYAQNYAGTIDSSLTAVDVECSEMRLEKRPKYVWEVKERAGQVYDSNSSVSFHIFQRVICFSVNYVPPPQVPKIKVDKIEKKNQYQPWEQSLLPNEYIFRGMFVKWVFTVHNILSKQ